MRYCVKYEYDLDIIEVEEVSTTRAIEHFKEKGYEYLYVYSDGKFYDFITCHDFPLDDYHSKFEARKPSILQKTAIKSADDVANYFKKNPNVERMILLENDRVYCEIQPMVEPALQNSVCKALMTLRYVNIFYREIINFLRLHSSVMIISDDSTFNYWTELFPQFSFDHVKRLSDVTVSYDLIFDFAYGNKMRKAHRFPYKVTDINKLVEGIAIKTLVKYAAKNDVHIKFYKLPAYDQLTCLHKMEYEHYIERTRIAELATNDDYMRLFANSKRDFDFVSQRKFNRSLRLDNGFFYTQEDCYSDEINVFDGVRITPGSQSNDDCICLNFYGPCTTFGIMVPDDETVTACLQKRFNSEGISAFCVNYGGLHGNNVLNSIISALNTPVKPGDYLIFLDVLNHYDADIYPNLIDTNEWYNEKKSKDDVYFFDFPGHCNYKANLIMANGIYDDICADISISSQKNTPRNNFFHSEGVPTIDFNNLWITSPNIHKMISSINMYKPKGTDIVGGIIIGNSDTEGLSGLNLDDLSAKCDVLYIFVSVEHQKNFSQYVLYDVLHHYAQIRSNVRIVPLDHMLLSQRYLSADLSNSSIINRIEKIEHALSLSVFRKLGINLRFIQSYDKEGARAVIATISAKITTNHAIDVVMI